MFSLTSDYLTVSINGLLDEAFTYGSVATTDDGKKIKALVLGKPTMVVFFMACGPLFVATEPIDDRKRQIDTELATTGLGVLVEETTASGDPHLNGAHGITFDVYGEPGANYSLVVAPALEVNTQLADRGPEMRFMTSMAVLYQGKSFVITPWTVKTHSAELIAHFEALGAKVHIDVPNWIITIELCAHHTIVFSTRHSGNINFLNFALRVPGCHDAYGGLLGQTYQCKYAHEKFDWSRELEAAFRVPTLTTPSGSFSPLRECAHEDEYGPNKDKMLTATIE